MKTLLFSIVDVVAQIMGSTERTIFSLKVSWMMHENGGCTLPSSSLKYNEDTNFIHLSCIYL